MSSPQGRQTGSFGDELTNAALIALTGTTSRGTLAAWSTPGAPASVTLAQLAGMSETDIAALLAAKDYDACYQALEKTRQVVSVLEAARQDAQLDF